MNASSCSLFKRLAHGVWAFISLLMLPMAPLIILVVYHLSVHQRASPPKANCTLFELAEKVSPPERLVVVDSQGKKLLFWIGPELPTVVSGPPCYIFDKNGRLMDWTSEVGDGWKFDNDAYVALRSDNNISLVDAMKLYSH